MERVSWRRLDSRNRVSGDPGAVHAIFVRARGRGDAIGSHQTIALLAALCIVSGCSLIQVKPEAEAIPIYFARDAVEKCIYLGEVIGSEGHWYNSWLLANADMTDAALNDLRNKAQERGADTLYIPTMQHLFRTSVTFLGQAYRCRPGEPPPRRDAAAPPAPAPGTPDKRDVG